jgi:hypothetical protein
VRIVVLSNGPGILPWLRRRRQAATRGVAAPGCPSRPISGTLHAASHRDIMTRNPIWYQSARKATCSILLSSKTQEFWEEMPYQFVRETAHTVEVKPAGWAKTRVTPTERLGLFGPCDTRGLRVAQFCDLTSR